MIARLQATLACDVRLQFRNGFYYAAGVVAVLFVLLLLALPAQNLGWLLPVLIVNNLIVNGFYFVAGLVLLEKGEGSLEAQTVTPLRPGEYLGAKIATLTLISLLENVFIAGVTLGWRVEPFSLILGIALGTAFYTLAGFALVARYEAINAYLMPSLLYVTVLALPLLSYFEIGTSPWVEAFLYLHPLQPILVLLGAAVGPVSAWMIAYAVIAGSFWVGVSYVIAERTFRCFVTSKAGDQEGKAGHRRTQPRRWLPFHFPHVQLRIQGLGVLQTLGPIDAKSVGRDALLRWMVVIPFVAALAIRWVLPLLVAAVGTWLAVDLSRLYPALMGTMFLVLVPYFWGMISGFLLLDQRDDGTLVALQVTPLSLRRYLLYRLLAPSLLSVATTLIVFPLTGLVQLSPQILFLLAVSVAPLAPLAALALAALAQNKVQGLALMKAAGIVLFPPLAAYFLPASWQWPFGLIPIYWPARFFWQVEAGAPAPVLYLGVGLLHQLALLWLLVRRFEQVMHR